MLYVHLYLVNEAEQLLFRTETAFGAAKQSW